MKRAKHSLSSTKLLSCDMGQLIPIGCTEVLPGDTFQQSTSALIRCSPLLAPVMHPVHVRIHHWFVPNRLVWDDWEDFITGGPDGMDASVYPTITSPAVTGYGLNTLADYMGVKPGVPNLQFGALPMRAYQLIYNEWYRDQDLETEIPISTASGADTTTSMGIQNVAWEKDYFTAARPWTQKGPEVTVPLGTTAPVRSNNQVPQLTGGAATNANLAYNSSSNSLTTSINAGAGNPGMKFGTQTGLEADLSTAGAASINDLRLAFAIQRYEEARARYGSRYTEYLRYLGVRSSDARLQRPEYLGGGKQTIQFSEVLQTAEGTAPVGEMRGHGIGAMRSNRYRRFFEEHGHVITLMSVKPKTIYADGLNRMFNRRTKEDYWQKELEHIGQQEILNKEVRAGHANPNGTFGFTGRYSEYRQGHSSIAGEFRTNLDFWHFARQFATDPTLNGSFVRCVPTEEPFAVPSANTLYVMANHSIQARRLVSASDASYIY